MGPRLVAEVAEARGTSVALPGQVSPHPEASELVPWEAVRDVVQRGGVQGQALAKNPTEGLIAKQQARVGGCFFGAQAAWHKQSCRHGLPSAWRPL